MALKKPGLSAQILIGLGLGVACGLFFGEYCAPFSVLGDAFIGLLQMTVLPYIVLSLLVNLGRLSFEKGRKLVAAGLAVLALFTIIGIVAVLTTPLALPEWETASFFSTSLVEPPPVFDLVGLYIPTNPFASLADNVVPAVVLFCIMIGIGLSRLDGTKNLLDNMDVMASALNRVNTMVVKLTPIGVFAIAASTAGTMTLEEIGRLQAYLLLYSGMVLVLTFWVVPSIVEACTPFKATRVLRVPRSTLLTIFATGKIIVVLPQLIENVKELFREADLGSEEVDSSAEVLMPLAYPFPNLGTVAILVFVPFSAWFLGMVLSIGDWLVLAGAGVLSSFVAPVVGIPFLMNLLHIPSDMFQLFVMSTVYTDRIRVVLGAVHLFALTIMVTAALTGSFKVKKAGLLRTAVVAVILAAVGIIGIRSYLGLSFRDAYTADQALVHMHNLTLESSRVQTFLDELPPPVPLDPERSRLDQIVDRGLLRVGFLPDRLPFAFVNSDAIAVGLDLELARALADDLGVELELVRLERGNHLERLADGTCDVLMSGLVMTPSKPLEARFTQPYLDQTLAFLTLDHRRRDFSSRKELQRQQGLRIGVVEPLADWTPRLTDYLSDPEIEIISSARSFARGQTDLDAILFTAEAGSAWTLLYPSYSVAIPQPDVVKVPMAFALPADAAELADYLNAWIEMAKRDGTIDRLYAHWILGEGAQSTEPRWSVIRDVLHWVG
jgi:Na+/H+-dicarboxylate symporter